MAFVNEYISEEDLKKYDLVRICGEHNLPSRRGQMHSRDWTIDRARDSFLIKVWAHQESEYSGYGFYLRGNWIFFEMSPVESKIDYASRSCWFKFLVKGMYFGNEGGLSDELISDLKSAITQSPGGVTFEYAHRSATIEFIKE